MPNSTKDLSELKGKNTINARAESITRGWWGRPFRKGLRCLVPASGFYEWTHDKEKQPFAFDLQNGKMMALAGLWDGWKNPADGVWLQTFTIITTDANELMIPVHNRMPVILHPSDFDRWLERGETHQPPIDLLRPFPSEDMETFKVSKNVGNVRDNSADLLDSA